MNLEEVFKLSGIPTITFVKPNEYNKLKVAIRTKGRGLIIEGPSGIGKTTSIINVIKENNIAEYNFFSARKKIDLDVISNLPTGEEKGLIIVDDFHILDSKIKEDLSNYLKTLADSEDEEIKLVLIGINKAGDSLVSFSNDLNNRIDTIKFESNPSNKVEELLQLGEEALNIEINIKEEIVKDCYGSFHLAQLLAFETCLHSDIIETCTDKKVTTTSYETIKEKVLTDLNRVFFNKAKLFSSGSRIRREGRAPYLYLLKYLSETQDWCLNIDEVLATKPSMKNSIHQIVDKGYLDAIIKQNQEIQDVLHYDGQSRILSIEDPKFYYYIKNLLWSKFSQQIGYLDKKFDKEYDIALSFASENRKIAELLYNELTEREISVFYDKNEQHRILAENVEDYLAPIYRSEAEYVVVLLSAHYPKKIWTKFESDNFKHRFGENSIIPIWFNDTVISVFDESGKYGGIIFNNEEDIESQIDTIVDTIAKKLSYI